MSSEKLYLVFIMQVDYVLILAAGKGTRMGKIGKEIPKVIWPIFNKSILELEVLHAKKYCKNQIYINVFNYAEKLKSHLNNSKVFNDTEALYEEETLDIGGAIHNLANKVGYTGKLLVINSDQFIMLSEDRWERFYKLSEIKDVVLLTYDVQGKELYNATIIKDNELKEIRKNEFMARDEVHETYTGVSIINLDKLTRSKGYSKFFTSVANYEQKSIGALNIKDSHYWDFGTIRRYYNSMFNILKKWNDSDPFIKFLKKHNVLDESLLTPDSYNSKVYKVINLGSNYDNCSKTIYLNDSLVKVPEQDCIVLSEAIEIVDPLSL